MNRRSFVKGSAVATLAVTLDGKVPAQQKKTRRPNVLYVFSDQHRTFSLPGEPFNQAMAPAMDEFRRKNLSMDACVSNYPLCSPYRAILMSGKYPTQNGVYYNSIPLEPKGDELGETFRKAGYHTGYIGKWHIAGKGEDPGFIPKGSRRLGFEDWQAWNATNAHYHAWTYNQETGEKVSPEGWQPTCMTDEAITFIKTQPKAEAAKPWMLIMSWNPPHPPYNPPPEELAKYPVDALKLRPNVQFQRASQETEKGTPHYLITESLLKEAIQGYYGAITGIDAEFARVLKALDDSGQADDTIVIYTSDHGEMMGSHGRMQKQVPYEESCRVPFMIRYPGVTPKAAKSDVLFSSIDIYPTLCGLAGIAVPPHCVGRDYSPVMRGQKFVDNDMVFLMNQVEGEPLDAVGVEPALFLRPEARRGVNGRPPGSEGNQEFVNHPSYRGVRTKTHTYAVANTGRWLLYDNVADPYQMKNLIKDPAQRPLLDQFDAAIMHWLQQTGDPFPYKDSIKHVTNFPS